ncbi:MAG: peroxiredoxin [Rhodanobacter sp. 68-29]|uniref:OsmC family protein n=1 Tax=Rhodanobacter sp. PCA2 TaxID=2006117 RepID=UPI0008685F8B|nr:OsmC family protein [Rhodanobacter sp. PCA2]MBA2079011.1 peroxiredoxin [Rhodanobacter sp. PCA2]MBN8922774.1 OsmC family protein [Rhodanobacter sp.]ODU75947.1 MAG: peroxiredoxin [Rhodanobacter sp. SCN 69-32]OJY62162.1 MAG: peroxiredoxin [Rhodanobacter sp. 68-29]
MSRPHRYRVDVEWTGNRGSGTDGYRNYSRNHAIRIPGKPDLAGSSDPAFRGDATRHNPEDMLVAALSTCHMLSYLHMATVAGVVVVAYDDSAEGTMLTEGDGGRFTEVVLRPVVVIRADSDPDQALAAHDDAHHACFIANSVNFPVRCEPRIVVSSD